MWMLDNLFCVIVSLFPLFLDNKREKDEWKYFKTLRKGKLRRLCVLCVFRVCVLVCVWSWRKRGFLSVPNAHI